jgi:tetratricopeptide (TPR) repeat protein
VLALLSLSSHLSAQEPAGRKCPTGAALKLDQVMGLIANAVPEDHIIEVIGVCHVGFSMDPAAVEKLFAAGISNPVFDALNRETISRMSVAAAHSEMAVLEERKQSNQASVNAARDAAIRKSDIEYKTRRDQAAYVKPKTIYDKTVDYDALVQKAQANVAAMDRSHERERNQITQQFAMELARKNEYLNRRIAALTGGIYPAETGSPVFVTYEADYSKLTVMIAGEEFWFTAEPPRAKSMNERWNSVRVLQRYEDGDSRDRFLSESSDVEPVSGEPASWIKKKERDKQIAALMRAGRAAYEARDYANARGLYSKVLALDPNNKEANEAINSRPTVAETKLATLRERLAQNPKSIADAWFDPTSNLLWTEKDNGGNIDWMGANNYCQALQIGDYADWRVPTISELETLFDISQTRAITLAPKKTFSYHMRSEISVTNLFFWSSDPGTARNVPQRLLLEFSARQRLSTNETEGRGIRVLCVQRLQSGTQITDGGNGTVPRPSPRAASRNIANEHTLMLTPTEPSGQRSATIFAPGEGFQNYNIYYIDTREFTNGGTLDIEIQIAASSATDGSFDLFPSDVPIPTRGRPVGQLAGRYDVRRGTSTHLTYRFIAGQIFLLGLEGNWPSPRGARGSVDFRASVRK